MNILFVFYVPSGGVETLNRQRFIALQRIGINCHFLYLQKGSGLQNKMDTTIFVTKDESEIKRIINEGNYKAIVVCSDIPLLGKIRNLGYKGKLIYENQGLGKNKEHAKTILTQHAFPYINKYCDGILIPKTPHLMELIYTYFPSIKKFCFHNCFDTVGFSYKGLPIHPSPIIAWVGRIEENKNWRDFLRIGNKLIRWNNNIHLWMFEDETLSDPNERIKFGNMINQLGLKEKLTIKSNIPHQKMADYFSIVGDSGGFLCSTSKIEGFGYAVLEAMNCRCPVLSTDSDGVRSFITHNETGKFFESGLIKHALTEAKELMTNSSLREKIRTNAVNHIQSNFSLEQYATNFLQMLNTLDNQ
ncbi:glycosyltransferase family 4 protein [Halalkalibacter urbisdiaboli]|uniref:glycosyltransferase family 4 protein n=1 Tax=Halalkalibacter urbisdiaboli TaxID=1960589 RepID=UPI000B43D429|nr:glycosyltransferase family 4 protein [Halalkalibacter urbisdiaboli]